MDSRKPFAADWAVADVLHLRPASLVVRPHCGFVLEFAAEDDPGVDSFALAVGPGQGWLVFERLALKRGPATFQSQQWQWDLAPGSCPPASVRGVLWSRRAALGAERSIAAFLRAQESITPAPASAPETDGHRSDPMSALRREIPFLLRIAHRLDEYLRLHEADRALDAESIERHLQRQATPPEQT